MPKHIFHRPANNGDRTIPRMLLPSFHFGDKGDKAWTRRHVCLIYPAAVLKHLYSQTLFWRLLRSPTKEKKKPVFILKTQKQKRKLTKETTKTLKKTLMLAKQARQLRQCSLGGGMGNPKMAKACTLRNDNFRQGHRGGLRESGTFTIASRLLLR